MQLILMRGNSAKSHTFSLKLYHLVVALVLTLTFVLGAFGLGLFIQASYGDKLPVIKDIEQARMIKRELNGRDLSTPLDAMAIRLAELQAQMARLNAIGNRLLRVNGLEGEQIDSVETPGRGGVRQADEVSMNFKELSSEIGYLLESMGRQADIFSVIDADMQNARVKFATIPNESPLDNPVSVSRFGSRIDPFTGRRARHEGIDFTAPTGTPILAAAAGVVVESGYHPGYGYMVDIEHTNDTLTRYAHASKLYVKKGDIVRMGQKIAAVGSTGRSTGPHLHFEVRVNGVPKDPRRFIANNSVPRPGLSTLAALQGLLPESIDTTIK